RVNATGADRARRAPGLRPGPAAEAGAGAGKSLAAGLLSRLGAFLGEPPVELAVRGKALVAPAGEPAVARVTFASRATLLAILADPPLRFGDAYSDGSVTVDGDLVQLLEAVYRAGTASGKPVSILQRATGALHRPHRNTLS